MHAQSFTAIAAGLLSVAALSSAAPMNEWSAVPVSTTTTSVGPTPTPVGPIATVLPDTTSQYHGNTGAVDFNTYRGLVSRSPSNGGADISSLVTFTLDAQYASNQCQLVFDLQDPSSYAYGTQKAQLFTSLMPATESTSSWPNGNLRNQALGTIDVVAPGRATWEAGSGPGATFNGYFPCSEIAGQVYGGEVVPVGDSDTISWVANVDGPKIIVW